MIKRLQRKFVLIAMGSLLAVMVVLVGAINAVNFVQMDRRADRLLELMGEKNTSSLGSLCRELGLAPEVSEDLCRLAALFGPPGEAFPVLEGMVRGERMEAALQELRDVCALIPEDHLRLDFSVVNDMDYYNGFIFRGYIPGLPSGVLSGGRYDNLLRQMGRSGGAVGFAVYMNLLERLEQTRS